MADAVERTHNHGFGIYVKNKLILYRGVFELKLH